MNNTELEILIKLKDEASDAFKKMSNEIDKAAKSTQGRLSFLNKDVTGLSKTILGATAAVGGMAVAFGVSAIKSFSEAQASAARMDAILKSMGDSAVRNRAAILQAAEATVQLGFDDEAAAESITKLYQRTNDLSKAIELNNFAMDLARFKNIDLSEASRAVNLALSGNVRVLKELGVVTDDTVSPLQALAEAQKKVSGQAASFSQTWQGMMLVLEETMSNFKDSIGQVLVEALQPFVQEFSGWLKDPQTKQNFEKWTANFKSWAEVVIPVAIESFKILVHWASNLLRNMKDLGEAILYVVNAMGKLISKGADLAKSSFKSALSGAKDIANMFRADGGPVSAGSPYIVGEKGPELFVPGQSGSIIPNGGGFGGSSVTVNISGTFYGSDPVFSEKMGNSIAKIIEQQLKLRTI